MYIYIYSCLYVFVCLYLSVCECVCACLHKYTYSYTYRKCPPAFNSKAITKAIDALEIWVAVAVAFGILPRVDTHALATVPETQLMLITHNTRA